MSQLNGYRSGQPGEILYNASGTSDDWTYGELGIASFTIEAGQLRQLHAAVLLHRPRTSTATCQSLMYVASLAKAPYQS